MSGEAPSRLRRRGEKRERRTRLPSVSSSRTCRLRISASSRKRVSSISLANWPAKSARPSACSPCASVTIFSLPSFSKADPPALAGILPWERIVLIDGQPIARSPRLDIRKGNAYLSVDRDPPLQSILCRDGDEITLALERAPNQQREVKLRAQPYSALEAARASARMMNANGRSLAYVHFWFIHSTGVLELMRELLDGPFSNAEGFGARSARPWRQWRGGRAVAGNVKRLGRPIVALTDRQSRSAKDALAYEFKQRRLATLVGEAHGGARLFLRVSRRLGTTPC